jgi:DNA-binding response OmpR family regulator
MVLGWTTVTKRVLVVEDSPIIAAAVSQTLTEAGYQVAACTTLEQLMQHVDVDLILMDVQMPELFGDDVAMVLRYERRVRAKIFLYSSLPADELAERVRAAGLDGYIEKDHGLEHLVTRVGEILKRAK